MTGIKLIFVAAALALVGAGCSAEISDSAHQPPRPASKGDRGKQNPPSNDRARDPAPEQVMAQKAKSGEGYVIIGNDDNPKPVKTEVKGGKSNSATSKPGRPAPEPPKPEEPTFTVAGREFLSTKDKAREDAIREAVDRVHEYLLEQDPPITRMPTIEMVRKMLLADQEVFKEEQITTNGQTETRYQATVAVKVRPDHIRTLRSRDRSSEALWVLAGLGALAGVIAVFFRIDAWTKGYLTSWLILGTVGAATLAITTNLSHPSSAASAGRR